MKALLTLLLLIVPQEVPEYGDIAELKDKQKVYLAADSADARKLILKELAKYPQLSVVASPDDAEFILAYKVLEHEPVLPGFVLRAPATTSGMMAYLIKGQRKRIAWSKIENDLGSLTANEVKLTRNFIKALKKAQDKK